ncbi:Protein W02B8.1 [Aphelenchoides avenae]|nr:Protein W02B8.1 [Aphelenchus avenae]
MPSREDLAFDTMKWSDHHIFLLGICILLGWMIVIVLCAAPQLFRDLLARYVCCCWTPFEKNRANAEKIKVAQERVRSASKPFLSTTLAGPHPHSTVLFQSPLIASNAPYLSHTVATDVIPEESRSGSIPPSTFTHTTIPMSSHADAVSIAVSELSSSM